MTISSSVTKIQYSGNGSTTAFAYPFKILDEADIEVVLVSSAGVETVQTITTEYTVSGVGVDSGGTITMVTAPAATEDLVLRRKPTFKQEIDYTSGDPFPAETHEEGLDRRTIETQYLNEIAERSLKLPIGSATGVDAELPAPVALSAIRTNSTATGFEFVPQSEIVAQTESGFTCITFTATEGQTVFDIGAETYTPGINQIFVIRNGAFLYPDTGHFTETDPTTVTLTTACSAGDEVAIIKGIAKSGVVSLANNVSYTPAGSGAVATDVQTKLREFVSVKDFGAVGDGVADDTSAIQAAIDTGAAEIYLPEGTYVLTSPLKLGDRQCLYGAGRSKTILLKTTNTGGTGTRPARAGTQTDSYTGDDIIQIDHPDNDYAYYVRIKDMTIQKQTYAASSVGIFAPRCTQLVLENVLLLKVEVGFKAHDVWMSRLTNVTAQGVARGFYWNDDGSGSGTGTSIDFNNCWVNFDTSIAEPVRGFDIFGLTYSSLNACGCDNGTRTDGTDTRAYNFSSCAAISMNGCGVEAHKGSMIRADTSTITVNSFRSFNCTGVSSGTVGSLYFNAATVTLIGCQFEAITSAGVQFDWVIQGGSHVTEINPKSSPTGGNTFVSYGTGSTKTLLDDGVLTKTDSTSTYTYVTEESGSFTPVLADASSGGNEASATTTIGRYRKQGDVVQFHITLIDIDTTGLTAGNQIWITGLPFATVNLTSYTQIMPVLSNMASTDGVLHGAIQPNSTAMNIFNGTTSGFASALVSQITSGSSDIYITGSYIAA